MAASTPRNSTRAGTMIEFEEDGDKYRKKTGGDEVVPSATSFQTPHRSAYHSPGLVEHTPRRGGPSSRASERRLPLATRVLAWRHHQLDQAPRLPLSPELLDMSAPRGSTFPSYSPVRTPPTSRSQLPPLLLGGAIPPLKRKAGVWNFALSPLFTIDRQFLLHPGQVGNDHADADAWRRGEPEEYAKSASSSRDPPGQSPATKEGHFWSSSTEVKEVSGLGDNVYPAKPQVRAPTLPDLDSCEEESLSTLDPSVENINYHRRHHHHHHNVPCTERGFPRPPDQSEHTHHGCCYRPPIKMRKSYRAGGGSSLSSWLR